MVNLVNPLSNFLPFPKKNGPFVGQSLVVKVKITLTWTHNRYSRYQAHHLHHFTVSFLICIRLGF